MNNTDKIEAFDTPARVRPEHMVINPDAPEGLRLFAIRDTSPLGVAFNKHKLENGRRGLTAADRYKAACIYRAVWDSVNASGGGSGGLKERVNSSPVAGGPEDKLYARQVRKMIEDRLSTDGRYVLRSFICEGGTGSEAINARLDGFKDRVWMAICLYLDDLCDAVGALGLGNSRFAPAGHQLNCPKVD
jgi:hypothetical protein